MAAGKRVGVLRCADLEKIYGETLEVRRSEREGGRWPFYLVTPIGALMFNAPKGQEFILEHMLADVPAQPGGEPQPAEIDAQMPAPTPYAHDPENPPPYQPPTAEPEKTAKQPGFLDAIDKFFEGVGE